MGYGLALATPRGAHIVGTRVGFSTIATPAIFTVVKSSLITDHVTRAGLGWSSLSHDHVASSVALS
jgi:hypothetical protein